MSTAAQLHWNLSQRGNVVTHALSIALKQPVEDPYRLLAIAVVGMAVYDREPIDEAWCECADINAEAMGVRVEA